MKQFFIFICLCFSALHLVSTWIEFYFEREKEKKVKFIINNDKNFVQQSSADRFDNLRECVAAQGYESNFFLLSIRY